MNDENALRIKAREALRAGKLPHSKPARMWGGQGSGARCTIYSEPVDAEELGFELQFGAEGNGEGNHHIHLRCFAAWEFERRHVEPAVLAAANDPGADGGDGYQQATVVLSDPNNSGTMCVQHEGTLSADQRDNSSRGQAV